MPQHLSEPLNTNVVFVLAPSALLVISKVVEFVIDLTFVSTGMPVPVMDIPTTKADVLSIPTVASASVVSQVASSNPPVKSQSASRFHSVSSTFSEVNVKVVPPLTVPPTAFDISNVAGLSVDVMLDI